LLQAWSRLETEYKGVRVVAVATRRPEELRDLCPHGKLEAIRADPTAALHRRFGAAWWPRVYVQAADGRLIYVQAPEHLEAETMAAVRKEL
jgi:hypothetical protein